MCTSTRLEFTNAWRCGALIMVMQAKEAPCCDIWADTAWASFFLWMGWLTTVDLFVRIKRSSLCDRCLSQVPWKPPLWFAVAELSLLFTVHKLGWVLESDAGIQRALGKHWLSSLPLALRIRISQKDSPLNFMPLVFINKEGLWKRVRKNPEKGRDASQGIYIPTPPNFADLSLSSLYYSVFVSLRDCASWVCHRLTASFPVWLLQTHPWKCLFKLFLELTQSQCWHMQITNTERISALLRREIGFPHIIFASILIYMRVMVDFKWVYPPPHGQPRLFFNSRIL